MQPMPPGGKRRTTPETWCHFGARVRTGDLTRKKFRGSKGSHFVLDNLRHWTLDRTPHVEQVVGRCRLLLFFCDAVHLFRHHGCQSHCRFGEGRSGPSRLWWDRCLVKNGSGPSRHRRDWLFLPSWGKQRFPGFCDPIGAAACWCRCGLLAGAGVGCRCDQVCAAACW